MSPLNEQDPARLINLARDGDSEALEQLLCQYRNYLAVLANLQMRRRLRAKIDESDLLQDTLLRACRDFTQFSGDTEEEFMHWLRTILACVCANIVRHYAGTQRRDVALERRLKDDLDKSSYHVGQVLVAQDPTPSETASRRERAKVLADALSQLPADYREVVVLHHLEGMTMAEVAQQMGRSANSVQKLWSRAIVRLRESLRNQL